MVVSDDDMSNVIPVDSMLSQRIGRITTGINPNHVLTEADDNVGYGSYKTITGPYWCNFQAISGGMVPGKFSQQGVDL